MRVCKLEEGEVAHRLVHTGAGYEGGVSFFRTPRASKNKGIASFSFMDLKSTALTHNRCIAIFEAVTQRTFDDRGGEAVTEFIVNNKLGVPDPSTGENLARAHFNQMTSNLTPTTKPPEPHC